MFVTSDNGQTVARSRLLQRTWSMKPTKAGGLLDHQGRTEIRRSTADFLSAITAFRPYCRRLATELRLPMVWKSTSPVHNDSLDSLGREGSTRSLVAREWKDAFVSCIWAAPLWCNRSSNVASHVEVAPELGHSFYPLDSSLYAKLGHMLTSFICQGQKLTWLSMFSSNFQHENMCSLLFIECGQVWTTKMLWLRETHISTMADETETNTDVSWSLTYISSWSLFCRIHTVMLLPPLVLREESHYWLNGLFC